MRITDIDDGFYILRWNGGGFDVAVEDGYVILAFTRAGGRGIPTNEEFWIAINDRKEGDYFRVKRFEKKCLTRR